MTKSFGFKELIVWQKSMDFIDKVIDITENLESNNKHYRLVEQMESAVTSVAKNIAEGKGRNQRRSLYSFFISREDHYMKQLRC